MSYTIKLVKLVSGDTVIGKYSEQSNMLESVAMLQTVPTQQGVQMILLPFGYPFEETFDAKIAQIYILYEYKKCPEDLENKYLEATSNITIASGSTLQNMGNISSLLK